VSVDFQVVFPQEIVNLSKITPRDGAGPRVLDIIGEDFLSVDEVLINTLPSPDVVVISRTRLLAQVPDQLQQDRVVTVSVTSRNLTLTPRSFIRFRISETPSKVRGILRLVQKFLKILFTTPGTDIFSQRTGAAGLKNIGQTFAADQGGTIVSDFVIAVTNTTRQIVSVQAREPSIPRDERLLSAKVLSSGFNRQEGALVVTVELTSQAGRAALANLEL